MLSARSGLAAGLGDRGVTGRDCRSTSPSVSLILSRLEFIRNGPGRLYADRVFISIVPGLGACSSSAVAVVHVLYELEDWAED